MQLLADKKSSANGKSPLSFQEWDQQNRRSSAQNITIDQKTETEFEKRFALKSAERWAAYIDDGDKAKDALSDVTTLRATSRALGWVSPPAPWAARNSIA